jgi:hypothetical protein
VNVVEVDERTDHNWEEPSPRFRVHLYEDYGGSYGTRSFDITGADVLEVIKWAQENLRGPDGLIAVGLLASHYYGEPTRGVVWLLGSDDVYADAERLTELERAVLDTMRARGPRPLSG